jgi:hypothetical protein
MAGHGSLHSCVDSPALLAQCLLGELISVFLSRFTRGLLVAALSGVLALPATAQSVDARASYVLTLGGINIAAMDVDLVDDGARYSLDLKANVAGLGSLVASGPGNAGEWRAVQCRCVLCPWRRGRLQGRSGHCR